MLSTLLHSPILVVAHSSLPSTGHYIGSMLYADDGANGRRISQPLQRHALPLPLPLPLRHDRLALANSRNVSTFTIMSMAHAARVS